ncbi:MAG: hypothetical protein AB4911_05965 [Oscillochloridaceae bacterium umkhey_bin13]
MNGYVYRVCPADPARLRALVNDFVGWPCWSFGGAAQWDFVPTEGQKNLREVTRLANLTALNLDGDFGHAFSPQAEVRWQRRDTLAYDVLILSEQPLVIADAHTLADGWTTQASNARQVRQNGDFPALRYIAYHAPNGALQFLRYTEVQP